jgi:hypothetical protein
MSEVKFSVVVVAWQVRDYLRRCLISLSQEPAQASFEVIVVDNASSDGSTQLVRAEFPGVKLLAQSQNLGFGQACNLGAAQSRGQYLVFLNPDTQVTPGFFSDLERAFIQQPAAAIVGGHLINDNGSTQASVRAFPSLWSLALDTLKLLNRFPQLAPRYLQKNFDYTVAQSVPQVMGACLAVRREVWDELKGFDPGFFVWFEEVDFCKRATEAGYKVWYESNLTLTHSRARSFSQLTYLNRHRLYTASLLRYARQHLGYISLAVLYILSRVGFLIALLADYVGRRG